MLFLGFFPVAFHVPTFVVLTCAAALIYMLGKFVGRNAKATPPAP
jgi:hypothetical protein